MDEDADHTSPRWQPWRAAQRRRATCADEAAQYAHNPSFTDHLPWVEYLEEEQCFLLDDNRSVGAVFELQPIGTEGREPGWLMAVRDALEDALQDSFDELDLAPWVVQFFCQDDSDFSPYLERLAQYVAPRATGTPFTAAFLASKPPRCHCQARRLVRRPCRVAPALARQQSTDSAGGLSLAR